MALRRKKKFKKGGPERLQMFHRKGGSWARDLESGSLSSLLDGALAASGIEAPIAWEQTGQLGTAALMSQWPDFLEAPSAVFLRRNPRKPYGLELNVDLEGDLEVQEYGEDLRRYLTGEARLTEFQAAVPVAEPDQVMHEAAPAVEVDPKTPSTPAATPTPKRPPAHQKSPAQQKPSAPESEPVRPAAKPAAAPAAAQPVAEQVQPQVQPKAPVPAPEATVGHSVRHVVDPFVEPQPASVDLVIEPAPAAEPEPVVEPEPEAVIEPPVEVFAPGERINKAKGRTWSQSPDDLFGLAGEIHPDDQEDHGLEIGVSDLPWLNPGDAIISPRRGPCRIKRVEDDARQVLAKDENKQMLVLSFDELLAEFQFDDGN
ncbi:MAG: hypothetical protein GY902_08910 [Planctomycetes bacterium]|nr:hypothetical protein [Planctomycetota bacterium]